MKFFTRHLNTEQWREQRNQIIANCAEKASRAQERIRAADNAIHGSGIVAFGCLVGAMAANTMYQLEYIATGWKLGIFAQPNSTPTILLAAQQAHHILTPANMVATEIAFGGGLIASLACAGVATIKKGWAELALRQVNMVIAQDHENPNPS